MLVLTRKLMEKVYIGDKICVTVVRLEGGQVRLGIDAPREISVIRAELLDERHHEPRPSAAQAREPRTAAEVRPPRGPAPGTGIRRRGPSR